MGMQTNCKSSMSEFFVGKVTIKLKQKKTRREGVFFDLYKED